MPVRTHIYRCPLCEDIYRTQAEAKECAELCLDFADLGDGGVLCSKCGKVFDDFVVAQLHEEYCTGTGTCIICKFADDEGNRHLDCPQCWVAAPLTPCGYFKIDPRL